MPVRAALVMLQPSVRTCYILFRGFSSGHLPTPSKANTLLEKVSALCTSGLLNEALSLFYTLNTPPHSDQTYATLFHACARHGFLQQGLSLHRHMLAHNNNSPDLFTANHLINMYAKCGYLDYAHQLFDEMPHRNIVSWTALISGYAQHGRGDDCFRLFSDMLVHFRPTEFAFASVLSSCGECERDWGRQVHALALKICYDAYFYVANALITMYWKSFGHGAKYIYDNDKDEAWTMFKTMEFRNLISWNSMITGFQLRGLGARALNLFTQMHLHGIGFDRATLLSVFSSLCGSDGIFVELGLKCCYHLHCLTIKTGFILEIEVATALVKTYSNLGGEIADCYRLFLETNGYWDVVSWTGIITAFAERDPEEALFLFCQMRQEELAPDRYTFSTVIKACAGLATERHALAVHSQIIKAGFDDMVLANALIHAYARCGSIALSMQVFDEMGFRDTVSWNSMLKAYALHGQAKESLNLFAQMNVHPDAATFVALLSACSHAGMVEEGTKIFDAMFETYGIVPQLDHFACMVDLLGRAGRIVEAEELINKMPMEPDSVVWSTLLGACRKHGKAHYLAKLAAAKLQELEPEKSLGYVQMSNLYCLGGNFNEAGQIRKEMKGCKVRKEPGLSWIEIGNRVHEFASGGQRHPQREAIYAKLKGMVKQLKEIGYVPETSLALHDIEEEHKEEQLFLHSEKLALVFAIMNVDSLHSGWGVIRIMKNIRICVDCHNFMKLASDLVQREIVVRDSNRFHHFKDRVCSCNDYW